MLVLKLIVWLKLLPQQICVCVCVINSNAPDLQLFGGRSLCIHYSPHLENSSNTSPFERFAHFITDNSTERTLKMGQGKVCWWSSSGFWPSVHEWYLYILFWHCLHLPLIVKVSLRMTWVFFPLLWRSPPLFGKSSAVKTLSPGYTARRLDSSFTLLNRSTHILVFPWFTLVSFYVSRIGPFFTNNISNVRVYNCL